MRTSWASWALVGVMGLGAQVAWAGGSGGSGGPVGTRQDWPCSGCYTVVPDDYDESVPTPLLVALHGDEGTAQYAYQVWSSYTQAHGYILLAPRCPSSEGCSGSWWQWAGDPAWLHEQIDAVEADYNIELDRRYGSAWSGGATYLGATVTDFVPRFAALNFNGGGVPPQPPTCPDCLAPAYFMIGDQDFLYDYAQATYDYLTGCGHETVWDELPGLDHQDGIGALHTQDKADTILDWMTARPNPCPTNPGTGGQGGGAGTAGAGGDAGTGGDGGGAATGGQAGGTAGTAGTAGGGGSDDPDGDDAEEDEGCGCRVVRPEPVTPSRPLLWLVVGLGLWLRRRRRRGRG